MKCTNCHKKIKATAEKCKRCGAVNVNRRIKTNKLGNSALVFAFFFSPIGLILGILAVIFGPLKKDTVLLRDGIIAIIMSIVVTAVWITLFVVLISLGVAAPAIIANL